MGKVRLMQGRATVVLDNGLADTFDRIVREQMGDVVEVLETAADEQIDTAKRLWPEKGRTLSPSATGLSRRSFGRRTAVRVTQGEAYVEVAITNDARTAKPRKGQPGGFAYAAAIKSASAGTFGGGRYRAPWSEFVGKPLTKKGRSIALDLSIMVRRSMLRGK